MSDLENQSFTALRKKIDTARVKMAGAEKQFKVYKAQLDEIELMLAKLEEEGKGKLH